MALRDTQRHEDPLRAADLQVRIAITLRERGRPHEALRCLTGVHRACLDAGDAVRAAGAVGNEAEIHLGLGNDARAEALFREAISMLLRATAPAAGPSDTEAVVSLAWARHGLGDVLIRRGDAREALNCHRLALEGFRAHGNLFGQAWAWHGTGDAERRRGRSAAAVAAYRRALALHDRVGSRATTGWTEQKLAEVLAGLDGLTDRP